MNWGGALRAVGLGGLLPSLSQSALEVPHHRFRDTGVGDPVETVVSQLRFVLGGQGPPVLHDSVLIVGDELKRSSSKLAAVDVIAWTLPCRIISASEIPNSPVLIAPANVTIIRPS